jgi:hypothetical protein
MEIVISGHGRGGKVYRFERMRGGGKGGGAEGVARWPVKVDGMMVCTAMGTG